MKMKWFTLILLSFVLIPNAFAKQVTMPFFHRTVPVEGLLIRYDMSGKYPQKVACIFDNFYKGYLSYTEDNIEKDSGISFGSGDSGDQFYFTSKGSNWDRTQGHDNLNQYHVDVEGYIVVKNTSYHSNPPAYATCFYLAEDSK